MFQYVPPTLTVDAVILSIVNGRLKVLLHKRQKEPFQGYWALPGAYCSRDLSIAEALETRVRTKLDVRFAKLPYFEQLYTFDTAQRDPRGPAVSVAYLGVTRAEDYELPNGAADTMFFEAGDLPADLAFDHADIVKAAVVRLRSKLLYTDIIKYALPTNFTLTQLQTAYQLVSGTQLDKRNFRKRFLALDVVEPTSRRQEGAANRPALLYTFKQHKSLQEFTRAFS